MGAVDFGLQVLRLYAGASFGQLRLREGDHNKAYDGTRIPLSVTISCTNRCNLKCVHCQSENDNGKDDIPTDRFLALIDEIADAGARKVGFTGGEPMVRRDFGRILDRCRERGLVVSVVANGWYVKRNIDWLRGIQLLFLSLDGDRELHDSIRGAGNFEKFLESVEAARGAGIPVAALTTIMSNNFPRLARMAEIVDELGLHWMVGLIQTGFTKRTEQDLSPEQVREAVSIVSGSRSLRTSKDYLRFVVGEEEMKRCFAGIGYCIIAPNGMLYPCFPAQFDHENYRGVALARGASHDAGEEPYRGVSILDKPFAEAFRELRLYRRTCGTCALACHAEVNYLYQFRPGSVRQSFRLMRPA